MSDCAPARTGRAPDVQTVIVASVSKALLTTERSKNSTWSYAAQIILKSGSLLC